MSDNQRLEELRRRIARDPASIAFAHLAEEYRRCGHYVEAVETCRSGLEHHPAYLSARVTLARALSELGRFDEAQAELDIVLRSAPENLAALRTLSEIQQRRGAAPSGADALSHAALAAAKDQEELDQMIRRMARTLDAAPAPASRIPAIPSDVVPGFSRAQHGPPDQPPPRLRRSAEALRATAEGGRHDDAGVGVPTSTASAAGGPAGGPERDLFTLFGAALNPEAGRFRDTAREEFFAGVAEMVTAPTPSSSVYPTLELKPAVPTATFDGELLANLSFREPVADEPVGFAPNPVASGLSRKDPAAAKEAIEARKLLGVLEQWLAVLEEARG